ncbi:hypothetical protein ACSBOB_05320 [Mesorhizobium sp. ASY16-5R]|uniref:hypothetical protein n=1 Tax=Mesorhizobium sp. ASY16-5R TaxID=3445772 RepID=UPI003FA11FF3
MTRFGLAVAALTGYVAYRLGCRLVEENSSDKPPMEKPRKVRRSPPAHVGVDVSAKTAD